MNRAERRRQERLGVSEAHIMQEYRKDAYDEGFKAGMRSAIEIPFYMSAYTIQYKLGFGKKRLQELMRAIYNNIDAYRSGHLEPQDYDTIVEQMQNEYGIRID